MMSTVWWCCAQQKRDHADVIADEEGAGALEACTYDNTTPFVPCFTTAKVVRVYDGDTLWLAVAASDGGNFARFRARLVGYDIAEVKSHDEVVRAAACGARDELTAWVLGRVVKVECSPRLDKYGRLVATLRVDGRCVNDYMRARWGVAYDGGRKPDDSVWRNMPRNVPRALDTKRPRAIRTS